jgi:hypothetical protein
MSFFATFSSSYLNLDEIKLGELVLNIRDPNEAFCPYFPITLTESDYDCRLFGEVGGSNKDERSSSFSAMLTKLVTLGVHSNKMDEETIRAKQAKTYGLKNHEPYLQRQLKDKKTMDWVLTHRRNKDIYMIIGYHTVVDAKVNNNHWLDKQMEVKATIPASEAALPGSSNTPIGQAMDVGLDAKGSHKRDQAISFLAPGERIIGIKYRKLRLAEVKSDTVNEGIGSQHRASDKVDSSFEITLENKDKWIRFTARDPVNSGPVTEKPVKELGDERDTGIIISCSFADMSETDLHDIMQVDYDLEFDQYEIGVFPRTMGGQEAAPQEAVTRGDKLVVEDESHEKSLWVFIDDRKVA